MSHLNRESLNIEDKNIEKLVALFPEVNTDGRIDFEKLKQILGDYVDDSEERYRFVWNGKGEALRLSQTPSMGTLRPAKEESKNWDKTENLYIEGDNLEVLKLLQKSYFNKVKMIYIDPPYNTGGDFVYKDNFKDNIQNYKKITGQVDSEGNATTTNREYSGRYHTDWLNMMYPRLRLARNLLKDDGLIFISIDDHEVHNLTKIADEIFGEENFIATLIWDRNHSAQAGIFKVYHEYILVYAKKENNLNVPKSLTNELFEAGAMKKQSPRHPMKEFTFPKGTRFDAPNGKEFKGEWGGVEKVILKKGRMISENGLLKEDVTLEAAYTQYNQMNQFFYGDKDNLIDSRGQKVVEFYLNSSGKVKIVKQRGVMTPQTTQKFGTQGAASVDLASIFNLNDSPIDSPKPLNLVRNSLEWFTEDNDLVLDFFAGSSTTAHATIQLNSEDNGNRKFIMVQLQEPTKKNTEAYKAGYENIAELGKERIRRAGEKSKSELNEKYNAASEEERKEMKHPDELDIGFKVFKLDSSNIKEWNPGKYENVQEAIEDALTPYVPGRTEEDVVYEMMLKMGLNLTYPVEKIDVNGKAVYSIGYGFLMICLADNADIAVAEKMIEIKDDNSQQEFRAIFRDEGFSTDTDKTNVKETLRSAGLAEESFITL